MRSSLPLRADFVFYLCPRVSAPALNTLTISRPFPASASGSNLPHPPRQKIGPAQASPQRLASPVFLLSISSFYPSCLSCLRPSRLSLPPRSFPSNKNNRLWNAFSCGITHRHQPPHAIRLSRRGGGRRVWQRHVACLPSSGSGSPS